MKTFKVWPVVLALILSAFPAAAQNKTVADAYRSDLFQRFLGYTQQDSQSQEQEGEAFPMTNEQRKTAAALYAEIKGYGFETTLSDHQYIYVQIPSNIKQTVPVLGLSAHFDTTPEIEGKNIKYQVHKNYQGGPIIINKEKNVMISPETDPHLNKCIGHTIVTSDGTTMLSGDDKSGVAILVTVIKTLSENPSIKRGPIQVVLAPNEDIGMSAKKLDEKFYKPDYLFDFDAPGSGEVIVENFSADLVKIAIKGRQGHPSEAKQNGMVDAYQPGSAFIAAIPQNYWPQYSEGREPYFHVYQTVKSGDELLISGRLRYFDKNDGKRMMERLEVIGDSLEKAYNIQAQIHVNKQYENVKYGVKPETVSIASKAVQEAGLTPMLKVERAGTTTAMIMAEKGFGGYTLSTGQQRAHSYNEWLSEQDMFDSYRVALNLIKQVIEHSLKAPKK